MTDIGLTGGGKGTHQMYLDGKTAHRVSENDTGLIEHIVATVEEKAAAIEAQDQKEAA